MLQPHVKTPRWQTNEWANSVQRALNHDYNYDRLPLSLDCGIRSS